MLKVAKQIDAIKLDVNFKQPCENPKTSKCDVSVWLRTCNHEIVEPVQGIISGEIPSWINGSLLRNGPGKLQVGEDRCKHLFDAAALLHRFNIAESKVTYQCKFLQSDSYKKNLAANRIVVSEFATAAVPDPCQSIFKRFAVISMSFE
jgi:carotenoid isomerooxygenase